MTSLLNQALEAVAGKSAEEQDQIARWLLAELDSDSRWQTAFAGSQEQLARLADEALSEHRSGASEPLDLGEE